MVKDLEGEHHSEFITYSCGHFLDSGGVTEKTKSYFQRNIADQDAFIRTILLACVLQW